MRDFHALPIGDKVPDVVHAVIEIPKGSRNKYEYRTELGVFQLDRVLSAPMVYVGDYGFVPGTLAPDGDPLDVLVLMEESSFTGCLIAVRPIGLMQMDDPHEDFKILAVPVGDKRFDNVQDLDDIAPWRLTEIQHFFHTYKTLDGSCPDVADWLPAADARAYILRSAGAFQSDRAAAEGGHKDADQRP